MSAATSARALGLVLAVALGAPLLVPAPADGQEIPLDDVVLTLYAADAERAAVDLETLRYSGAVEEGDWVLDDAGLVFDAYRSGSLTYGFRRNEAARLVDLGPRKVTGVTTSGDIAPRPDVTVFETLRVERGRIVHDAPVNRTVQINGGQAVFGNFPPEGAQHVVPVPGHTYLLRVRAPKAKGGRQLLVKILVLDAEPEQVTLRIVRLA